MRLKTGFRTVRGPSAVFCAVAVLLLPGGCKRRNASDETPLHEAAYQGDLTRVASLLARGADINAKDRSQDTALHDAARQGHVKVVKLLLTKRAKINARGWSGWTPLHAAVCRGHGDVVELLVSRGADLNIKDGAGYTALHRTLQYGRSSDLAELLIAGAMHFSLGPEDLHREFADLQEGLNRVQEAGEVRLHVANALWPQSGYDLLPTYRSLVEARYGSRVTPVDFAGDRAGACATINRWVEERTEGRITSILRPEALADPTYLVLLNAIYFKGPWKDKFDRKDTRDDTFYLSLKQSVRVPLMYQEEEFGYAESESMQIVELPYRGDALSMLVLLPRRIEGLRQLEESLSSHRLEAWRSRLTRRAVEVFLPRFRAGFEVELAPVLQAMGMKEAFVFGRANFAGIDGRPDWLFLGNVIHKAFVEVNEEGTEAAAVTGEAMMGGMPPKPPEFRVDHPFLFLIQENRTGSILFLGRVVDPR